MKIPLLIALICLILAAALLAVAFVMYRKTAISEAYRLSVDSELKLPSGTEYRLEPTFQIVDEELARKALKNLNNAKIQYISTDPSIVEVTGDGVLKPHKKGNAAVTVRCEELEAVCRITVYVPLKSLQFEEASAELAVGETKKLQLIAEPENAELPENLEFTSEREDIVFVSPAGEITAKRPGSAKITVSWEEEKRQKSSVCTVNVCLPMQSLSLNDTDLTIMPNDSFQFRPSFEPADTTDDKTIEWSVSDESVAAIDQSGKLTALTTGDVTVTASCGKLKTTCEVHVSIHLAAIHLAVPESTVSRGNEFYIPVAYEPENTSDDLTVKWTSSNSNVAEIDPDSGKIRTLSSGTAVITADCGGHTDTCELNVTVPVTSIAVSELKHTAELGSDFMLQAFLDPYDTTEDRYMKWRSSDPEVATVDSKGKVNCLKEGTAKIIISHDDYSTACEVTVYDPAGGNIPEDIGNETDERGRIFIGDSRFNGMQRSVTIGDGNIAICKGGEYFTWFMDEAIPELRKVLAKNPYYKVIINMGLNDCANNCAGWTAYYVNDYIDLLNQLVKQYPVTEFYFASIGYTDGMYSGSRRKYGPEELRPFIDTFNAMMCVQCDAGYIDLGEHLNEVQAKTADGVHYGKEVNQQIFDYLMLKSE